MKEDSAAEAARWQRLTDLFQRGVAQTPSQRQELLAEDCGEDAELAAEVAALWEQADKEHPLFKALGEVIPECWQTISAEPSPPNIARCQILEVLGSGGMGTVYKAYQVPPLDRHVAVKVLPPELGTETWREQFTREQGALSAMSHPYIATVYDAGVDDGRRPYLVMEYLAGTDLVTYCNENQLGLHARLKLFMQVCSGLQHAHQKGLIHCDVKPSNILVVKGNEEPVAKLIDFGIARPIRGEKPHKAARGTPNYMSPEQMTGSMATVDTRSDIYALGCLLFELLVGVPPHKAILDSPADWVEKSRLIQTNPPPIPSGHTAAGNRTIPRELDWITTKALAVEPNQRYQSCAQLIEDLQRFLNNQPVLAAPGGMTYPLRKWMARNRALAGMAVALVMGLAVALTITLIALNHTIQARDALKDEQEFTNGIFQGANPYHGGKDVRVVELLENAEQKLSAEFQNHPIREANLRLVLGNAYRELGLLEAAVLQFSRATDLYARELGAESQKALAAKRKRAYVLTLLHDLAEAETICRSGLKAARKLLGGRHPLTREYAVNLALILMKTGQKAEAYQLFEEVLPGEVSGLEAGLERSLSCYQNYGYLLMEDGRLDEAEAIFETVLARYQTVDDPFRLTIKHNLARVFFQKKEIERAQDLAGEVLALRKRILPDHHPDTLSTLNLSATLIGLNEPEAAVEMLEQTLENIPESLRAEKMPLMLNHSRGHFLMEAGRLEEAEAALTSTWRMRKEVLGEHDNDTVITGVTLGEVYLKMNRHKKALETLNQALNDMREGHPNQEIILAIWREAREAAK